MSVHFYAGASLIVDSAKIGTLCVLDTKPRKALTAEEQATLIDIADAVSDLLSERRRLRLEAQAIEVALQQSFLCVLQGPLREMSTIAREVAVLVSEKARPEGKDMRKKFQLLEEKLDQLQGGIHFFEYVVDFALHCLSRITQSSLQSLWKQPSVCLPPSLKEAAASCEQSCQLLPLFKDSWVCDLRCLLNHYFHSSLAKVTYNETLDHSGREVHSHPDILLLAFLALLQAITESSCAVHNHLISLVQLTLSPDLTMAVMDVHIESSSTLHPSLFHPISLTTLFLVLSWVQGHCLVQTIDSQHTVYSLRVPAIVWRS